MLTQLIDVSDALSWLSAAKSMHSMEVQLCDIRNLESWDFIGSKERLAHASGRFFSIIGISTRKIDRNIETNWNQPIVHQPEIGLLGLALRFTESGLQFLVQAKSEPGNINSVQISPTIQATESNIDCVHGQESIPFVELFIERSENQVIADVLQSEQGGRFFQKRNRNMIIDVTGIEIAFDSRLYMWIDQKTLYNLLGMDNIINMDLRSVLSCIPLALITRNSFVSPTDSFSSTSCFQTIQKVLSWLTKEKFQARLVVNKIPLLKSYPWRLSDSIFHPSGNFFRIKGIYCKTEFPKEFSWYQPIVEPCEAGLIAFIAKIINGSIHFLVQAKLEAGCFDYSEIAPTVQCLTGNINYSCPPRFFHYIQAATEELILYDQYQSEEGGRFFKESNRNLIVLADDNFDASSDSSHTWISYSQLKTLCMFGNMVNVQARCLLSAFDSVAFNKLI